MRVQLTVDISARMARAIAHQWGFERRATRSEMEVWFDGHITALCEVVMHEYLAHQREERKRRRRLRHDG
ncbi:MAG: hypothetical protein WC457_02160 [Patescibacteria group bacterium]